MNNEYTWDEVPETVYLEDAPVEFRELIVAEARKLLQDETIPLRASAGYVYDRKGYYSFQDLTAEQIPGRPSMAHEDLVIQLTLRVPHTAGESLARAGKEFGETERARQRAEERRAVEEQIAVLQGRLSELSEDDEG